jgi:hypothetical protein
VQIERTERVRLDRPSNGTATVPEDEAVPGSPASGLQNHGHG